MASNNARPAGQLTKAHATKAQIDEIVGNILAYAEGALEPLRDSDKTRVLLKVMSDMTDTLEALSIIAGD